LTQFGDITEKARLQAEAIAAKEEAARKERCLRELEREAARRALQQVSSHSLPPFSASHLISWMSYGSSLVCNVLQSKNIFNHLFH
jgi:hypothetical protein